MSLLVLCAGIAVISAAVIFAAPSPLRARENYALDAVAQMAMERKVGARGLRMILEDLMLDLMYYLPTFKKVKEFVVTKEMVLTQKINMTVLEKAG